MLVLVYTDQTEEAQIVSCENRKQLEHHQSLVANFITACTIWSLKVVFRP